ncbi:FAD/NAD(P)-binding protein [Streptomyces sp. NPDC047108]|uniref:FAD/NAD(P)-binding protein n=1 Tax=Streptomyces sp. NPDC047108 TaxID=3155025 RepID=UPI0033CECC24
MTSHHSIAVIGGGAAGTAFLAAYARELSADGTALPADVHVFEPTDRFGPGVAYARDTLAALLNRPMSAMSVDHNDPGHFRRWLHRSAPRRHTVVLPTPREATSVFAPRAAFGNYLEGVFQHACGDLEALGARVTTVRDAVLDVTEENGEYTVTTAGGGRFTTGSVVLAVGSLPPADVFGLGGAPGFVAQPYPLARSLRRVDRADEVLVLGCGLTAIDCALVLSEQGRRVTLASRSGFVPDVRAEATARWDDSEHAFGAHELASSGTVRLAEIYALIDTCLRERGTSLRHAIRPYAERLPVADLLRSRLADLGPVGLLQRCVTGMTPAYSALWRALPPEDQRTFLRRHNRVFSCVRNPMPPENARKLIRLADAGSLDFRRGITAVREEAGGGFTAVFSDGRSARYGGVVNAVGRTLDVTTAPEGSLLRALSRRSLVAPHPAGGVQVEPATNRALRPDGSPHTGFHVVGDLSSGVHFHSSSMEYVARQAARVARHTVNASGRYALQAV